MNQQTAFILSLGSVFMGEPCYTRKHSKNMYVDKIPVGKKSKKCPGCGHKMKKCTCEQ